MVKKKIKLRGKLKLKVNGFVGIKIVFLILFINYAKYFKKKAYSRWEKKEKKRTHSKTKTKYKKKDIVLKINKKKVLKKVLNKNTNMHKIVLKTQRTTTLTNFVT